jgi:hypothetical protein
MKGRRQYTIDLHSGWELNHSSDSTIHDTQLLLYYPLYTEHYIAHVVKREEPTLFYEAKTEELAKRFLYVHQSSSAHGTTPLPLLSTPTSTYAMWVFVYDVAYHYQKAEAQDGLLRHS